MEVQKPPSRKLEVWHATSGREAQEDSDLQDAPPSPPPAPLCRGGANPGRGGARPAAPKSHRRPQRFLFRLGAVGRGYVQTSRPCGPCGPGGNARGPVARLFKVGVPAVLVASLLLLGTRLPCRSPCPLWDPSSFPTGASIPVVSVPYPAAAERSAPSQGRPRRHPSPPS